MNRLLLCTLVRFKSSGSHIAKDIEKAYFRGYSERRKYIKNQLNHMLKMDEQLEKLLSPLRLEVKAQGDLVRSLKEDNAPKADIDAAVRLLKEKKRILEAKEESLVPKNAFVDKTRLEDTLKRRFFFDASFSIYGGIAGLIDYGPYGVGIKKNILRVWESHFVLEDDLLEIEATQLTPAPVLKASGHVDRFADLMIKDTKTGDCYRLDHLISNHLNQLLSKKNCPEGDKVEITRILQQLDNYSEQEMADIVKKFGMKAPATGNDLSEPVQFNLMFSTSIGPTGLIPSFLRPETAQGIFVNFKRLLDANQDRLPFGVAQIGKSFRNEISPRGGLTRMREFTMAEIEYFVDPQDKKHDKYSSVKDLKLNIYSACNQMSGESAKMLSLGEAVDSGIIANEVLAYYIGRIYLFMVKVGVDPSKMRFRQHMSNEMAHYATDCWDCECLSSTGGWLECIGCADRSCYDLNQHSQATKTKLTAHRKLDQPKPIEFLETEFQRAAIGKNFRADAKDIIVAIEEASQDQLTEWENEMASKGLIMLSIENKTHELTKDMLTIKRTKKNVHVEDVVPNVIEPSFGIDRITQIILEHNYRIREDNALRTYFTFPALIAPIKCSILRLGSNEQFLPYVQQLSNQLKLKGVRAKVDSSTESIGRRYARTDEIGIPFGVTVDFDTLNDQTVTLRDCASLDQVRLSMEEIPQVLSDLSNSLISWSDVSAKYPKFMGQQSV